MNKSKPLYGVWDIMEVLPIEECDTNYWPWYVSGMIDIFSKNPEVEILYDEPHTYISMWWDKFYYYQYKIRDCNWQTRYVNEGWIRPKFTTALFI